MDVAQSDEREYVYIRFIIVLRYFEICGYCGQFIRQCSGIQILISSYFFLWKDAGSCFDIHEIFVSFRDIFVAVNVNCVKWNNRRINIPMLLKIHEACSFLCFIRSFFIFIWIQSCRETSMLSNPYNFVLLEFSQSSIIWHNKALSLAEATRDKPSSPFLKRA